MQKGRWQNYFPETGSPLLYWKQIGGVFFYLRFCGGMCGLRAFNTSNSGSGGPGFKPRMLRCFFRQGTLLHFVSLHPGVKMGTSNILLGVAMRWTSIPSRGSSNTPMFHAKETRISSGHLGLWLMYAFTFSHYYLVLIAPCLLLVENEYKI